MIFIKIISKENNKTIKIKDHNQKEQNKIKVLGDIIIKIKSNKLITIIIKINKNIKRFLKHQICIKNKELQKIMYFRNKDKMF